MSTVTVTRATSHQSTVGVGYCTNDISTYIGLLLYIPSHSNGMLAFRSTTFQNGNLSKSMTQCGKEMMAGRWQGMLWIMNVREALDQTYLINS